MYTIACILYEQKKSRNDKKHGCFYIHNEHNQRLLITACYSYEIQQYILRVPLTIYESTVLYSDVHSLGSDYKTPCATTVSKIRINQKPTVGQKIPRIRGVTGADISPLTIRYSWLTSRTNGKGEGGHRKGLQRRKTKKLEAQIHMKDA